ncbi:uncharacterized protein LOC127623657 [Xyrauchen texanus]|uniref:uncharacterized protein LOC127623657 n=1 Tax=Xyrauchen texanus TaxID=154827 RepID=UPI002241BDB7|nr:uncharacterized protein LOC127623657 [Xyrauchen texanus]
MKRFGIVKFFQPKKKRGELDTGGEDRERRRETGEKLDKDEQHKRLEQTEGQKQTKVQEQQETLRRTEGQKQCEGQEQHERLEQTEGHEQDEGQGQYEGHEQHAGLEQPTEEEGNVGRERGQISEECESETGEMARSSECQAGPHDISKLKADDPTQPVLKVFPKTMQGGARRSFHGQWYEEYPWLEYSVAMDAAYCFACRHFSSSKTVYTSSAGYKNWRKATFKDGGFSVHSKSEAHLNAMTTWRDHQKMMKRNISVLGMMNDENRKQIKENQQYIKTIGQVLRLTAIQNIAQRGHN